MIFKNSNRFIRSSGRFVVVSDKFVINSTVSKFPKTITNSNNGGISMRFNAPTTVRIDYGNGVTIAYPTVLDTGNNWVSLQDHGTSAGPIPTYAYTPYIYPDTLTSARIVSIYFDKSLLVECNITGIVMDVQDLRFEFAKYPNMEVFSATRLNTIVGMNLNNAALVGNITDLSLQSAFHSSSPYFTSIPLVLLGMPLITFGIGSSALSTVNFASSNLDKLVNIKDTLVNFTLSNTPLVDNNFGDGALPSNFDQLVNLVSLTLSSTHHTTTPPIVLTMSWMTNLTISGNSFLTSLGDLSAMVNLVALANSSCPILSTSIPTGFDQLTLLKSWDRRGMTVAGSVNNFVDSMYTFIVANAAITGSSSLPFRGMTFSIQERNIGDGTEIPTGTYQQPTGYIAGVSNGTPASQKEKIWLMVNQYGHTWTYRTV